MVSELSEVDQQEVDQQGAPVEIFLASRNPKKLAEMERILGESLPNIRVLGLDDVAHYEEPVEDHPTFEGNALLKARAGAATTGLPTLADDSGLCVDALHGMPGVLSARWSGLPRDPERNIRLLLDQPADVPPDRRGARFACAVAFVVPGGATLMVEGRMAGRVTHEPRGSGGFAYDVVFEAEDHPGLTTAELSPQEKDAISHRGRALREIAPLVAEVLSPR